MNMIYDVMILGAGPAGLSAALYAGRSGLSVLLIEKGADGGQIAVTDEIENYPGQMPEGESGASLIKRMSAQAERFGSVRVRDQIQSVDFNGEVKKLQGEKEIYQGRYVIIAAGAMHVQSDVKVRTSTGEAVFHIVQPAMLIFSEILKYMWPEARCAVEEAIYLTRFARKVTIIHRRDELRAVKAIQERAFSNPKIDFLWNSVVEEVHGAGILQGLTVRNVKTGEKKQIEADPKDGMIGLFGFVGNIPNSALFQGILDMDENGYIRADEEMQTSVTGVYVAGDIRVKSVRQVVTAAADGAIAAVHISGKCN